MKAAGNKGCKFECLAEGDTRQKLQVRFWWVLGCIVLQCVAEKYYNIETDWETMTAFPGRGKE